MKQVNNDNTHHYWKCIIRKAKVFINLLDTNENNTGKNTCIVTTEDKQKNNAWSWKSADTVETSSNFEKKIKVLIPDAF